MVIIEPGIIKTEFGEVMHQPMLDRSAGGPYEELAKKLAASTEERYQKPNGSSDPEVIANVIQRAIQAKKPRTRYAAGKMAKPILFMRKMLSDKAFDKIIMSQVKG